MSAELNTTRASLNSLLQEARRELLAAIEGLEPEQMLAPVLGEWSVKDILAHVAMWEEVILPDMRRAARGDRTALQAWDDSFIDQWNHMHFVLRKGFPVQQVLAELEGTRREMLELLRSVDQDLLTRGFIPATCAISARHDREHASDIRNWRQQEGV